MISKAKYGQWACVAGAAEGLGEAFAEGLAQRGMNLILTDLHEEKLTATSDRLRKTYSIDVIPLTGDLAHDTTLDQISSQMEEANCRLLVYNAAYGPVLPFMQNTEKELDVYLNVNNRAVLILVHRFIGMKLAGDTGILLISSLAGFRGTQLVIPYAATKAFLWNLAEGLYYEFKGKGLDISVLCPGTIDTPNFRATGANRTFLTAKPMAPAVVAEEALRKFGTRLFIVPGLSNKIAHFLLQRVLPRKLSSKIHNDAMGKLYQHKLGD